MHSAQSALQAFWLRKFPDTELSASEFLRRLYLLVAAWGQNSSRDCSQVAITHVALGDDNGANYVWARQQSD